MIKVVWYLAVLALVITCPSAARPESQVSDSGKTGMSFLSIAPSSRTAALGGIAEALPSGASSMWSNPSLIVFMDERSVQFTHTEWIEGIKQEYVAFSTKFDYGSLGLSVHLFNSGDIDGRGEYGDDTGTWSITNGAVSAVYAARPFEWLSCGIAFKKLYQKISQDTAGGYGFDGGVTMATPLTGLSFAAGARNYGSMEKLRNERTKLPSNISLGCLYSADAPEYGKGYALILDIVFPRYGTTGLRLGIEYEPVEKFFLRTGYRTDSDFEDMSFGAGYDWGKVSADVAYTPMNDISEDALRFTLSFTGF